MTFSLLNSDLAYSYDIYKKSMTPGGSMRSEFGEGEFGEGAYDNAAKQVSDTLHTIIESTISNQIPAHQFGTSPQERSKAWHINEGTSFKGNFNQYDYTLEVVLHRAGTGNRDVEEIIARREAGTGKTETSTSEYLVEIRLKLRDGSGKDVEMTSEHRLELQDTNFKTKRAWNKQAARNSVQIKEISDLAADNITDHIGYLVKSDVIKLGKESSHTTDLVEFTASLCTSIPSAIHTPLQEPSANIQDIGKLIVAEGPGGVRLIKPRRDSSGKLVPPLDKGERRIALTKWPHRRKKFVSSGVPLTREEIIEAAERTVGKRTSAIPLSEFSSIDILRIANSKKTTGRLAPFPLPGDPLPDLTGFIPTEGDIKRRTLLIPLKELSDSQLSRLLNKRTHAVHLTRTPIHELLDELTPQTIDILNQFSDMSPEELQSRNIGGEFIDAFKLFKDSLFGAESNFSTVGHRLSREDVEKLTRKIYFYRGSKQTRLAAFKILESLAHAKSGFEQSTGDEGYTFSAQTLFTDMLTGNRSHSREEIEQGANGRPLTPIERAQNRIASKIERLRRQQAKIHETLIPKTHQQKMDVFYHGGRTSSPSKTVLEYKMDLLNIDKELERTTLLSQAVNDINTSNRMTFRLPKDAYTFSGMNNSSIFTADSITVEADSLLRNLIDSHRIKDESFELLYHLLTSKKTELNYEEWNLLSAAMKANPDIKKSVSVNGTPISVLEQINNTLGVTNDVTGIELELTPHVEHKVSLIDQLLDRATKAEEGTPFTEMPLDVSEEIIGAISAKLEGVIAGVASSKDQAKMSPEAIEIISQAAAGSSTATEIIEGLPGQVKAHFNMLLDLADLGANAASVVGEGKRVNAIVEQVSPEARAAVGRMLRVASPSELAQMEEMTAAEIQFMAIRASRAGAGADVAQHIPGAKLGLPDPPKLTKYLQLSVGTHAKDGGKSQAQIKQVRLALADELMGEVRPEAMETRIEVATRINRALANIRHPELFGELSISSDQGGWKALGEYHIGADKVQETSISKLMNYTGLDEQFNELVDTLSRMDSSERTGNIDSMTTAFIKRLTQHITSQQLTSTSVRAFSGWSSLPESEASAVQNTVIEATTSEGADARIKMESIFRVKDDFSRKCDDLIEAADTALNSTEENPEITSAIEGSLRDLEQMLYSTEALESIGLSFILQKKRDDLKNRVVRLRSRTIRNSDLSIIENELNLKLGKIINVGQTLTARQRVALTRGELDLPQFSKLIGNALPQGLADIMEHEIHLRDGISPEVYHKVDSLANRKLVALSAESGRIGITPDELGLNRRFTAQEQRYIVQRIRSLSERTYDFKSMRVRAQTDGGVEYEFDFDRNIALLPTSMRFDRTNQRQRRYATASIVTSEDAENLVLIGHMRGVSERDSVQMGMKVTALPKSMLREGEGGEDRLRRMMREYHTSDNVLALDLEALFNPEVSAQDRRDIWGIGLLKHNKNTKQVTELLDVLTDEAGPSQMANVQRGENYINNYIARMQKMGVADPYQRAGRTETGEAQALITLAETLSSKENRGLPLLIHNASHELSILPERANFWIKQLEGGEQTEATQNLITGLRTSLKTFNNLGKRVVDTRVIASLSPGYDDTSMNALSMRQGGGMEAHYAPADPLYSLFGRGSTNLLSEISKDYDTKALQELKPGENLYLIARNDLRNRDDVHENLTGMPVKVTQAISENGEVLLKGSSAFDEGEHLLQYFIDGYIGHEFVGKERAQRILATNVEDSARRTVSRALHGDSRSGGTFSDTMRRSALATSLLHRSTENELVDSKSFNPSTALEAHGSKYLDAIKSLTDNLGLEGMSSRDIQSVLEDALENNDVLARDIRIASEQAYQISTLTSPNIAALTDFGKIHPNLLQDVSKDIAYTHTFLGSFNRIKSPVYALGLVRAGSVMEELTGTTVGEYMGRAATERYTGVANSGPNIGRLLYHAAMSDEKNKKIIGFEERLSSRSLLSLIAPGYGFDSGEDATGLAKTIGINSGGNPVADLEQRMMEVLRNRVKDPEVMQNIVDKTYTEDLVKSMQLGLTRDQVVTDVMSRWRKKQGLDSFRVQDIPGSSVSVVAGLRANLAEQVYENIIRPKMAAAKKGDVGYSALTELLSMSNDPEAAKTFMNSSGIDFGSDETAGSIRHSVSKWGEDVQGLDLNALPQAMEEIAKIHGERLRQAAPAINQGVVSEYDKLVEENIINQEQADAMRGKIADDKNMRSKAMDALLDLHQRHRRGETLTAEELENFREINTYLGTDNLDGDFLHQHAQNVVNETFNRNDRIRMMLMGESEAGELRLKTKEFDIKPLMPLLRKGAGIAFPLIAGTAAASSITRMVKGNSIYQDGMQMPDSNTVKQAADPVGTSIEKSITYVSNLNMKMAKGYIPSDVVSKIASQFGTANVTVVDERPQTTQRQMTREFNDAIRQ